jgi:hypothetical protein
MNLFAAFAADGYQLSILRSMRMVYAALIGLYLLVMAGVWAGVFYWPGGQYVGYACILSLGFAIAAAVSAFAFPFLWRVAAFELKIPAEAAVALIFIAAGLVVAHWLALGRIPAIAAFETHDPMQAALIRDSIHRTHIPLLGYIPTIVIWSTVPFLGVYFIGRGRYALSWLIMIIGLAYGLSLMQKLYPLIILAPAALYCLLTRRLVRMVGIAALAMAGMLVLFVVANPRLIAIASSDHSDMPQRASSIVPSPATMRRSGGSSLGEVAELTANSLAARVFALPGKVVVDWFTTFPNKIPYEKGCGYRFLAPFLGCEFENIPERLYPLFYPEQAAAGVKGTYNAAHFAEEYANFGPIGLLFSGIFAAVALGAAAVATSRAGLAAALGLNLPAIMALTSAALHTTLLTFGWMFMMILTIALYPPALPGAEAAWRAAGRASGAAAKDLDEAALRRAPGEPRAGTT